MLRRSDPSASRGIPAEMQGSAFAIEVAPIPRSARTTIWLVVAVLVCGLAWAQWAEMDEIVVAQGKLTTVVLPTVIQPLAIDAGVGPPDGGTEATRDGAVR